jgi:beta-lactamase superfamily II metal-dependent hydrolase
MPTTVHYIDVGQGNMTLILTASGHRVLYDCNLTSENEARSLDYLGRALAGGQYINMFVNSHRDADHMRGVKTIHRHFPILSVLDTGVVGTSPDCDEYRDYMDLRRTVGYTVAQAGTLHTYGATVLRTMNAASPALADDANAQSIVLKVENRGTGIASALLTGDSDALVWKGAILPLYGDAVRSSVLLGSHHGSLAFFDDPANEQHYYLDHLKKIAPVLTVVSVGPNVYGHPEPKALELYLNNSSGTTLGVAGVRLLRTDQVGNIRLDLYDDGSWWIRWGVS